MSGAVKPRAAAPNSTPPGAVQNGKPLTPQRSTSEVSDDVSTDRVDGNITLDVLLPNGQRTDIIVDYSTPMLDLLVCLAGKCKLNPSGLALQLLSEDTGQPLTYKPNQMVGSLGGRTVRIVNKDDLTGKSKNKKQDKPFEITNRFTINIHRGQKVVLRVSPLKALAEIVSDVCNDKGLDPRGYILQLPGQPGVIVDMRHTVQQVGVYEMNLISSGLNERNHTTSMPNLTQTVPKETVANPGGETKKKKGFLSFLSKKDKRPKLSVPVNVDSNQNVNTLQTQKVTTPPIERNGFSTEKETKRPKSMFVMGSQLPEESVLQLSKDKLQPLPRKKKQAPAPPVPPQAQLSVTNIVNNKEKSVVSNTHNNNNLNISSLTNKDEIIPLPQNGREDIINRLHSRNSSDSSGYHEITLSGCESPEAVHHNAPKFKSSIDSTSSESSDNLNANGSVPGRISPIVEVHERAEVTSKKLTPSSINNLPSMKKRKAPAPPAPPSAKAAAPPLPVPVESSNVQVEIITLNSSISEEEVKEKQIVDVDVADSSPGEAVTSVNNIVASGSIPLESESHISLSSHLLPEHVVTEDKISHDEHQVIGEDQEEKQDVNVDSGHTVDINDILEGIVFDEEPQTIDLRISSSRTDDDIANENVEDGDEMMMMETASVTSENIEELVITPHLERPCAFIPPPPPTEPPPPVEPDVMETYTTYEPVFVDKGTEVNDDNTSLAPLSAKSSPGTAHKQRDSIVSLTSIDTIESLSLDFEQAILMGEEAFSADVEATAGYKNEMALFVERMSKIAMQNTFESTDDSTSLSVLSSDNNSDTGSVIRHFRADSKDSESEPGSLTRLEGRKIGSNLEPSFEYEQDWHDVHPALTEMPAVALPPPPEFNDENETTFTDEARNDEEKEELVETVEELIVPLGPKGYDFAAAKKVSEVKKEVTKESVIKENIYGVFRAEPLSISSLTNLPTLVHHNKPKAIEPNELPPKKEEFVLTNEDLSSLSFLPPKVLRAKLPVETTPLVKVSRTSLFLDNSASQSSEQAVSDRPVTVWNDGRAQTGNKTTVSVRTMPVNSLPSMRVSRIDAASVNQYTDQSLNDPLASRSAPRLVMKAAQGNGSLKPTTDDVDGGHVMINSSPSQINSDSLDGMTHLDTSVQSYESKESIASLEAQFSKWEEQLTRNKNLLASQVIEKKLPAENGNGEFQDKSEAKMQKLVIKATETAPSKFKETSAPPPAPPPVPQEKVVKSEAAKAKPQSKSRFEPQLDPREQLMIAIRNFNGRSSLKAVPVQQTHWYGD